MFELEPQVKEVDLIFKTHMDIGFTDYARNVVGSQRGTGRYLDTRGRE